MIYQTYSIALSQFVEFLWIREGDNLPESQSRLLPIGSMELVINLHGIEYRCLNATVGQSAAALTARCSVVLILKPSSSTMVTKFLSWECISNRAAVPLSSAACRELHNQIISLNELWHGRAATTRLLAKTLLWKLAS